MRRISPTRAQARSTTRCWPVIWRSFNFNRSEVVVKRTIVLAGMLVAVAISNLGAGYTPLLFTVLDIDSATSLPWNSPRNYLGIVEDYDVRHLVADTKRLLTPTMPTIVRMETLRRAAVYASRDRQAAEQLVAF